MEAVKALSIEEFIRLYDEQGPFEYVNGEFIPVSPTNSGHNILAKKIMNLLDGYTASRNLGEAFMEAPFVLEDKPNWVKGSRVPDVMFFRAERLKAFKANTPDWREKPFLLVPDLVVEIISPTDRYSDVADKI